ncbi:hypothetical protein BH09MYX1_BH09MYX1_61750 [soil metagenome]
MTSSMAATQLWYTLSTVFGGVLGFGTAIAFLIGAFIVRGRRPDAFPLFLTACLIQLGTLVLSYGMNLAIPMLMKSSMGYGATPVMEEMARAMFLAHVLTALLYTTGNGILLAGILRLSKPPETGNAFAEGRYT